jgi:hypothetical protein
MADLGHARQPCCQQVTGGDGAVGRHAERVEELQPDPAVTAFEVSS